MSTVMSSIRLSTPSTKIADTPKTIRPRKQCPSTEEFTDKETTAGEKEILSERCPGQARPPGGRPGHVWSHWQRVGLIIAAVNTSELCGCPMLYRRPRTGPLFIRFANVVPSAARKMELLFSTGPEVAVFPVGAFNSSQRNLYCYTPSKCSLINSQNVFIVITQICLLPISNTSFIF